MGCTPCQARHCRVDGLCLFQSQWPKSNWWWHAMSLPLYPSAKLEPKSALGGGANLVGAYLDNFKNCLSLAIHFGVRSGTSGATLCFAVVGISIFNLPRAPRAVANDCMSGFDNNWNWSWFGNDMDMGHGARQHSRSSKHPKHRFPACSAETLQFFGVKPFISLSTLF